MIFNNLVSSSVFDVLLVFITLLGISFCLIAVLKLHLLFIIILSKIVAVIAKVDCRVFCHINSLRDKISNTAAQIQPNPFWFWEKYIYIFIFVPVWQKNNISLTPVSQVNCQNFCPKRSRTPTSGLKATAWTGSRIRFLK